jgi:hypothetical protein
MYFGQVLASGSEDCIALEARYLFQYLYGFVIDYIYVMWAGPYLGILRPWAQENFAPPPYLFVFSYV